MGNAVDLVIDTDDHRLVLLRTIDQKDIAFLHLIGVFPLHGNKRIHGHFLAVRSLNRFRLHFYLLLVQQFLESLLKDRLRQIPKLDDRLTVTA